MSLQEHALELWSALVLEDGRRLGHAAADFQLDDARAIFDPEGPPYHFLTRSRGSSKTSDLAGIALVAMLLLPSGSKCYALAADRDQARLLLDAAEGFIRRSDVLASTFKPDAWKVTCRRNRVELIVLAADAASSWGIRPAFTVVDELASWGTTTEPRTLWESISSSAAKVKGSKLVVLTTAGSPAHWSHKILEHAREDPLWRVSERPGPAPWMDADRLAEQKRRLTESAYLRLFENQWVEAEDMLATLDDLRACVVLDGPLDPVSGRAYVIGLDVGVKHDRSVAAIAHAEQREVPVRLDDNGQDPAAVDIDAIPEHRIRVVLDRIAVWEGSREQHVKFAELETWLRESSRRHNHAPIVFDPWQALDLAQRLRAQGVAVQEFAFSSSSVGRLASTLHLLIRDHALALPDDPELIGELSNVRLRELSPGVVRMDHDPDKHDDRAVALALAAQHVVARSAGSEFTGPALVEAFSFNAFEMWTESPWETSGAGLDRGSASDPWAGL